MPLEHAILALLDFGPQTGYDLKKIFDRSVAHFWSTTQSHIYKALEKLEEGGFAESKFVPQEGKPGRKEYRITGAGQAELRQWLSTPLPLTPVREAWMIQLFFSHTLSNEQIAGMVKTRQTAVSEALQGLEQGQEMIERQKKEGPPDMERMTALWQLTLDYGAEHYKSESAWLEKVLEAVANLPSG